MNGTGNQFLTCTRLAEDKDGRVGWCHCLHKFQNPVQGLTFADDLLKISFAANLVLQIELLLCELVAELGYLAIGQRVFHCNRYLRCNLRQKVDILLREANCLQSRES